MASTRGSAIGDLHIGRQQGLYKGALGYLADLDLAVLRVAGETAAAEIKKLRARSCSTR